MFKLPSLVELICLSLANRQKALVMVLLVLFSSQLALAADHGQDCKILPMEGIWINDQAKLQEIKRMEIKYPCPRISATNDHRPFIYIEVLCNPRNCLWGIEAGRYSVDGQLFVVFNKFIASHVVTFKPKANGELLVRHIAEYRSATRPTEDKTFTMEKTAD